MAGIMAASAPPPDLPPGWAEPQSTGDSDPSTTATIGLELGMSGMSLLPLNGGSPPLEETFRSSGDSVHSYHSTGTASSTKGGINRPPGLGGLSTSSVPPIGKPGHAKSSSNCSTTVQTATLTPTSSLDGGASNELYGLGRQTSPLSSDQLPGISNIGSFDTDDGEHDGLLGLQALRDRAHSSPGPMPMMSGGYSTSPRELGGMRGGIPSQQGRPRTVSKDSGRSQSIGSRPPLAGGSALSPHTVDGGFVGYSGSRSRDASPPPNAGIISRPYSPYGGGSGSGNEYDRSFDSSLRRALSSDSSGGPEYGGIVGGSDHLSSKFSPLPLNSQQRVNNGGNLHGQGMYNQRQQRSYSQPGPARGVPGAEYYPEEPALMAGRRGSDYAGYNNMSHRAGIPLGMDNEYAMLQEQDMRYNPHTVGGVNHNLHGRSMSMQHSANNPNIPDMQRRGSTGYFGVPQRRSVDYSDDGSGYQHDRIGNTNYPRQDRLVSPAHSPMHVNYGNHSRASSDMGSTVSSSPMSLTSGHQPLYGRHHIGSHSDEDLSHPLVGEHIEVPGEEHYFDGIAPYPRSSSMGHATQYGVDSHHLPTAGASIAMPKVVYNVKFKRTQRTFELGPRLNRDLKVGTYVKVEADRGEDLGIVVGKVKNSATRSASFGGGMGELPSTGAAPVVDSKKIIRLATHDEVSLLQMKRDEEEELLKVCRTKVRQRGLPMNVVDAEYQFDRHKLTFFFEAEGRIDFRELVRDLFSMYKTRIWMQQLDKSTTATCPVAPAPAPLVMDYGTPIIAPASEYEEFAHVDGAADENTD